MELRRSFTDRSLDALELLLTDVATLAEREGARISFRFRHRAALAFSKYGKYNLLYRLEYRGHEVGTHAHGQRLRQARDAVSACGVRNKAIAPGFVQARDPADRLRLWRELVELGFFCVTDVLPPGTSTLSGICPWRPDRSLSPLGFPGNTVFFEVSAEPFEWGLLRREIQGIVHRCPLQGVDFERLEALRLRHAALRLPAQARPCFLFTLHEHNLCAPGSLRAERSAMEALARFLGGCEGGVHRSTDLAGSLPSPAPLPPEPLRHRLRRLIGRPGRLRLRFKSSTAGRAETLTLDPGDPPIHAVYYGPDLPRGALLLSHSGARGGSSVLLEPFGLLPQDLERHGIALVAWDRRGTGKSPAPGVDLRPGNPLHAQDCARVFDTLRARLPLRTPIGGISWSAGVLPLLNSARPLAFLMDGEAPADRLSLLPPQGAATRRDPTLEAAPREHEPFWRGREPAELLGALSCPYHRLQGAPDHAHGYFDLHAHRMVEAASEASLPRVRCNGAEAGSWSSLRGPLADQGPRILEWILEEMELACAVART